MRACPQHAGGHRHGFSKRKALVNHIRSAHSSNLHLADLQICQLANLHTCTQCNDTIFSSEKKLISHMKAAHPDSRTTSNIQLCTKHIQGALPPNYNPIWPQALQFISCNIAPDPANFRSGVSEMVPAKLLRRFDDVFANLGSLHFRA